MTEIKTALAHRIMTVPCRTSYILYFKHTSYIGRVSFVFEFVVGHTLQPIVTLCIISGGCRLTGGTCRLHLHDRGSDVNQNDKSALLH
jgi:hypothetical protein